MSVRQIEGVLGLRTQQVKTAQNRGCGSRCAAPSRVDRVTAAEPWEFLLQFLAAAGPAGRGQPGLLG
jgi:hypothetical protein